MDIIKRILTAKELSLSEWSAEGYLGVCLGKSVADSFSGPSASTRGRETPPTSNRSDLGYVYFGGPVLALGETCR